MTTTPATLITRDALAVLDRVGVRVELVESTPNSTVIRLDHQALDDLVRQVDAASYEARIEELEYRLDNARLDKDRAQMDLQAAKARFADATVKGCTLGHCQRAGLTA